MLFNEYQQLNTPLNQSTNYFFPLYNISDAFTKEQGCVRSEVSQNISAIDGTLCHQVIHLLAEERVQGRCSIMCYIQYARARTPAARSANISLVYCKHNSILSYVKQSHNYGKGKKKFRCPHACEIILS